MLEQVAIAHLYESPGTDVMKGYSLAQRGLNFVLYSAAPSTLLVFLGFRGDKHSSSSETAESELSIKIRSRLVQPSC